MTDLHYTSATELADSIARKEVSPVEVVDAYVERIERLDSHYRAFLTPTFEQASDAARKAEQAVMDGDALGPLHGVPVGLKDLLDTAGVATTCGSTILRDNVPTDNAPAVDRLLGAGAIVLGKLQMTEFAGIAHHPELPAPRNPHDPTRSPGGSSSGSGVAVAAGLCTAALGSDTVASIRNPAAWNGCVGFKPTWGRVSRRGVFPLAYSYDHVGPLTRTVEDAALLTGVLSGHDPGDSTSLHGELPGGWPQLTAPSRLRIGYDESFVATECFPNVVQCVTEAIAQLMESGAEVVPVTIPLVERSLEPYSHLLRAEVAAAHQEFYPRRAAEYSPEFRAILEASQEVTRDDVVHAHLFRAAFMDAIADLFTRVDILVMPVGPLNAPPPASGMNFDNSVIGFMRYTYHWNLAGVPAIALPWGLDEDGLPGSVQLVGPHGHDARVLSVARDLQRPHQRPPEPTD